MAVMGSIFITQNARGVTSGEAHAVAHSTQVVVYMMAGIMAAAFVLAKVGLKRGPAQETEAGVEVEDREALAVAA
jgi:hypothetical protein